MLHHLCWWWKNIRNIYKCHMQYEDLTTVRSFCVRFFFLSWSCGSPFSDTMWFGRHLNVTSKLGSFLVFPIIITTIIVTLQLHIPSILRYWCNEAIHVRMMMLWFLMELEGSAHLLEWQSPLLKCLKRKPPFKVAAPVCVCDYLVYVARPCVYELSPAPLA